MSEDTVTINHESMLPVGTLLQGGKYRIDRYLSSGGFGNTYVATNTEFEEQVAIKEFFMRGVSERQGDSVTVSVSNKDNVTQFSAQKEKFRKEARRLCKLRNQHIVAVHDLFEENGTAYYEMDLIKGESLSERLKRTGLPLMEQEALHVLDQVLDALQVVHAQGLYHLDLKPANIMVDGQGRALLIDFGASKQMSQNDGYSVSTSSALAFTPGYAPLEQTEQNLKAFGPWTDLYALGATLYKLLTNQTPPSASEILMMASPLPFTTPVSAKTQQLINWMMKPRLDERPQNVAAVRQFLNSPMTSEATQTVTATPQSEETEQLLLSKPKPVRPRPVQQPAPPARPQSVVTEPEKPKNRTWVVVVALVVGVCFILGLVGGVFLFNSVTDDPEPPTVVIPADTTPVRPIPADTTTVRPVVLPSGREEPTTPPNVQTTPSKPTKKPTTTSTVTPVKPDKKPQTTSPIPSKLPKPSQPVQPSNQSNESPMDNFDF